jgi:general secretion pathway protein I
MHRRGFTMLEVMVALALFAMAAIALGAAYVNVLNSYAAIDRAAHRDEDLRFARTAIFLEADRTKAEEGGEFESADGRRVRWAALIEPTELPDLFTVNFTCETTEPHGGGTRVIEQSFRLLRPTWSEGLESGTLRKELSDRILEYQGKQAR